MKRTGARAHRAVVLGLALAGLPCASLLAQSDPRLTGAIELAQAGRQDSAVALVRRLLATLSPTDSAYPEALYTAGILGVDNATITTNLQRVVIEYGQSPWADDALLRLIQFHFAQGDHAATTQAAQRLRRDYPESALRPRAAFFAARAYFALRDETQGCNMIREARQATGTDVEFQNQVQYYAGRCGARFATGSSDTAPSPGRQGYDVQVLAVRNAAQVDEMLTRLKVMGFDARVVRDTTGFFKVRVGPYPSRAAAEQARSRLQTKLGGKPFLVEAS